MTCPLNARLVGDRSDEVGGRDPEARPPPIQMTAAPRFAAQRVGVAPECAHGVEGERGAAPVRVVDWERESPAPRRSSACESACFTAAAADVHDVELLGQRLDDARDSRRARPRGCVSRSAGARELQPPRAQVGHGGHGGDLDPLLGHPLDVAQQAVLARLGERDRDPFASRAAGAADAVHVRLGGASGRRSSRRARRAGCRGRARRRRWRSAGRPCGARNFFITRSRCSCDSPPCSASAR